MEKVLKRHSLIYLFVSIVGYFTLVLLDRAGISVPIFALLQCVMILLIISPKETIQNKWGFLFLLPIFILSLNSFLSANPMWKGPNFLVLFLLYACLSLSLSGGIPLRVPSVMFFFHILENMIQPLRFLPIPFCWALDGSKGKLGTIKRIAIGIIITVPCILFLISMLSAADMVFSEQFSSFLTLFSQLFSGPLLFKVALSILAGLYLFGILYFILTKADKKDPALAAKTPKGDAIILSILLFSILLLYTFFIILQFRYLFAQSALPYHLSYSEYARRGFFELVLLSVLNIGLILLCVSLLKEKIYHAKTVLGAVIKCAMLYLCGVTAVLLASSFYRMSLYDSAFGYTRLRVLVYGFLIFEGLGLLFVLLYVWKPSFNIFALCAATMLCYYLVLNLVSIDAIIAKRNVDRFFNGEKTDLRYLSWLSPDAAPQIARLITQDGTTDDAKLWANKYFNRLKGEYLPQMNDWRSYNLSIDSAASVYNDLQTIK